MSTNHDDELQRAFEKGADIPGEDLNVRAYREIFSSLSKQPDVAVPMSFADRVMRKVIEKKKQSDSRDFIWFGVGIFFLLICFVVAIAMSGATFNLGFLRDMSGYAGLFVFGVAMIIVFNWADKRFIRRADS